MPDHDSSTAVPSFDVGGLTVYRIDEVPLPPETGAWLLPEATAERVAPHDWLRPDFADEAGTLRLHSHSFAMWIGGLRVLVDTGIGNGKSRANPAWHDLRTDYLQRLARIGFTPDNVDLVVLTHLHTDHVGWNTRQVDGQWRPTFPNARYLTSRAEWDFWSGYDMDEQRQHMFNDSVHPVRDAGLLELVDVASGGAEIVPGLRLLPTPGHTPGHVAVEVRDQGSTALITGDSLHHPVQLAHPGTGSSVDIDPGQAERSRRDLLESVADTGTLLLGTHFPPPAGGLVYGHGDAYWLEAAAQTSRWCGARPSGA